MPKKKKNYDHMYRKREFWYVWGVNKVTGERVTQATKSKKVSVAIEKRKKLLRELDQGKTPSIEIGKTRLGQLEELVLEHYEDADQNIDVVKNRFKAIFGEGAPFTRKTLAIGVTSKTIREYIRYRRQAWKCLDPKCGKLITMDDPDETLNTCPACKGKRLHKPVKGSTIKKELMALTNGFRLGIEEEPPMVNRVPTIPKKFGESEKRWVEIENDEHKIILNEMPEWLKGMVVLTYKFGFRLKEIMELSWKEVNLRNKTITLKAKRVKGKYERTIPLDSESCDILKRQKELRMKYRGMDADQYVWHRSGRRIRDIRGSWKKAVEKAGCPHKKFHDYRRTATRNMLWSGRLPERAVMDVLGWRSREVMDHYMFTKEEDRRRVAEVIEEITTGKSL